MRKWIILLIVTIGFILVYNYVYQDHRNIETEQVAYSNTATSLHQLFKEHPTEARQKYLDKSVELSGTVSQSNINNITLNGKVFCVFLDTINFIKINRPLTIKGRIVGYDDLLEEIKLDQCTIIK